MRQVKVGLAAAVAATLAVSGCGSPSSNNGSSGGGDSKGIETQQAALDPTAKGPAAEVPGAKKGGVVTVYSQSTPSTFDPTDIYYVDANAIAKLVMRSPTQFALRNGKPVLVPDLTDLGTVSADKLTWTFKLQPGIKYADGSEVKVEDLAYAIKRSFAHDVFANGPTYQMTFFKDGDKYKGPYTDGDAYSGVETPDASTLVIHLSRPFADLPFYLSFPAFTPIPKAKDTKENYKNNPLATGPYQFDTFTPGTELKLKKNPNWDPETDPVRHQYPDGFDFKWGGEDPKTQQQVLNSAGEDANALNYGAVDASLIPQLTGDKKAQLIQGDNPCTYSVQLDTRKIPLEVRKAIAKAYPYDQVNKAGGLNSYNSEPASTVLPPSVPGYTKYDALPDLSGVGQGDPAGAKALLEAAGKVGFELSWYYDNTKPIPQQTNQIRVDALKAAGFTVKPIGVPTAELRAKIADYDAPVNMGQAPQGWCSDWPSGSSWFPVLFQSHSISDGTSWGMLSDKALDAKIDEISNLPVDQATAKWAELDKEIMGMYVALPRYYGKLAFLVGANIGGAEGDATMGEPFYPNLYLKN
ncbi:ABC transporter substrate-binding protein [Micromonospora avicenniae]|uniref:Peptide/nickel transport system substrate-binding protein n=1 Tax=Micromonospora avicenniae TaxID=1198245 RepID=A0A1N7DD37_9ACTN|nr:ABC transporter substrate-binding protein [Micromonospora avicenniae]SIR73684.1 peptide/nickel transport system substrate-binding protein [Micromonospora avicenniae]